jgi:hypothetical protein
MKNLLNIQVAFTEVFGVFLLGLACCVVNVFLQYQSASGVLHIEIETDKKVCFNCFGIVMKKIIQNKIRSLLK